MKIQSSISDYNKFFRPIKKKFQLFYIEKKLQKTKTINNVPNDSREEQELQPLFAQIIESINDYKDDVMSYEETLIQRGLERGLQRGLQRGKLEKQELAKELLRSGVDKSIVARASHLTEQELEQIQKSLH